MLCRFVTKPLLQGDRGQLCQTNWCSYNSDNLTDEVEEQVHIFYHITIVFAHSTVTNEEDHVSRSKGWAELTPIQNLLTLSTPIGAPARMFSQ